MQIPRQQSPVPSTTVLGAGMSRRFSPDGAGGMTAPTEPKKLAEGGRSYCSVAQRKKPARNHRPAGLATQHWIRLARSFTRTTFLAFFASFCSIFSDDV